MSNTPIQVTTDLSKVLEQINSKLDTLHKDVTDLKVSNARIEEKIEGIGKRLENQEFVSRSIVVALVIAILGGFAKLFGVIGNP